MIIDTHQHLNFWDRSNDQLIDHQIEMGVKKTILLSSDGTYGWYKNHRRVCNIPGGEVAYQFCLANENFKFGANADHTSAHTENILSEYLDKGAVVIGELKFCENSQEDYLKPYIDVAKSYDVPIIIHFQRSYRAPWGTWMYPGLDLSVFEKTLADNPEVKFIAHAVDFWGEMDALSNVLMTNYPNFFADTSAGSCLKALQGEGAAEFLTRHQDKIVYGSDCADPGHPDQWRQPFLVCDGKRIIDRIKDLVDVDIQNKIFYKNAMSLYRW